MTDMNDIEVERTLAMLIANTKTKSRTVSLVELSKLVANARSHFGSLKAVGQRIGISGKMLGQFLAVDHLVDSVKNLVDSRAIDSVDAVAHLSQMVEEDQREVASRVVSEHWSTADIRAFCEARKRDPDSATAALAEKISLSRSTKQFVFEFVVRGALNEKEISRRLQPRLSDENVISISAQGTRGELVVDEVGYETLQNFAKSKKIALRSVVPHILYT